MREERIRVVRPTAPAARGSAATYSQPAPAVREGGGGDALTFLSLQLQASDFLLYLACCWAGGW